MLRRLEDPDERRSSLDKQRCGNRLTLSKCEVEVPRYVRQLFTVDGREHPVGRAAARGDGSAVAGLRRLAFER